MIGWKAELLKIYMEFHFKYSRLRTALSQVELRSAF